MSEHSQISWCDATWNFVLGCSKISPGCRGCYAINHVHRMAGNPNPKLSLANAGLTIVQNGHPNWTGKVRLIPERLTIPLRKRKPTRYFVNSLSDLFHPDLTLTDLEQGFRHMLSAPQHTYLILTKRADVMAFRVPIVMNRIFGMHWAPPQFIQLGFSAENQEYFDSRWPRAKELANAGWMTWASYEPALGSLDARDALCTGLRWIVCGGESGPNARPMHPTWAQSIRDQCYRAGVPFHFKQWGRWQHGSGMRNDARIVLDDGRVLRSAEDADQETRNKWPSFCPEMMAPVGKKAAGRLLDGREWNEFPEVVR